MYTTFSKWGDYLSTTKSTTKPLDLSMCPRFEQTFSILGKKWNGLIIDALLKNDTLRFKDLTQMVDKCSDRVLIERLRELEEEEIVVRMTYADSSLIEYGLTEKGRDLAPVMESIHGWSESWMPEYPSCEN